MSTVVMGLCWPLQMPPTPKSVLISLADNANDHGFCWPSIPYICMRTCFKRTAVIAAIAWLEEHGRLVANRSNGRRTTYQITVPGLADDPAPVRQTHQSAKRTSSRRELNRSGNRTGPVRQTDTNHQEPSKTVNSTTTAFAELEAPQSLSKDEGVVVVNQIKTAVRSGDIDAAQAQCVLDELEGAIRIGRLPGGTAVKNASRYMRGILTKAARGCFTLEAGRAVQHERAARLRAAAEQAERALHSQERATRHDDPNAQKRLQAHIAAVAAALRVPLPPRNESELDSQHHDGA